MITSLTGTFRIFALASCTAALAMACPIAVASDVGERCDTSEECAGDLGCVATNVDVPQGARVCMPPPQGFDDGRCKAFFFGDKDAICDCGCGAHDVDCATEAASVCDAADGNHCPNGKTIVLDDNARCE